MKDLSFKKDLEVCVFLQLLRVYLFIFALLLSMSAIYALRVTIRSRNECFIYKMCA